jgi:hypothetical protein
MDVSPFWNSVEPQWDTTEEDGNRTRCCSFYSEQLKADLLPGTFVGVLFSSTDTATTAAGQPWNNSSACGVGRIVCIIVANEDGTDSRPPHTTRVQVNIFKRITDFKATTPDILPPEFINENKNLWDLPEVVQVDEVRLIASNDIVNLAFVFTPAALRDSCNLFFACQGMAIAFIVRSRYQGLRLGALPMLTAVPPEHDCLPFPSSYVESRYFVCYSRRIWNSSMCLKLEMTCSTLSTFLQPLCIRVSCSVLERCFGMRAPSTLRSLPRLQLLPVPLARGSCGVPPSPFGPRGLGLGSRRGYLGVHLGQEVVLRCPKGCK